MPSAGFCPMPQLYALSKTGVSGQKLTIAVDPKHHGQGVGKRLFTELLDKIKKEHPETLRVELIARESNLKATKFYESLGFVREGRFERRLHNHEGAFEADIPMAWFNPEFKLD
jgi:ribosomal protein S18 acetylase RimI-like enzyme